MNKFQPNFRSSLSKGHVIVAIMALILSFAFVSPALVSADTNETATGGPYSVAMSAISGGANHTCALLGDGTVECWGRNDNGQLGDGTTTTHKIATPVTGLTGVVAISAGGTHTCALLNTGGVKCWGWNFYGAIGNGGAAAVTPQDVTGLTTGVVAISAGTTHSCALLSTGAVKCWGSDNKGQLGTSASFSDKTTPVSVDGLSSGVTAIAAGNQRTCAILTGGALKCWGENANGAVGDNTLTDKDVPTAVTGLSSGVVGVSVGTDLTCAVMSTGTVKCWGRNLTGQLGNGTTTHPTTTPTDVSLISNAVSVSTGGDNSCALLSSGEIKCWGNNTNGPVGDGTTSRRTTPVLVTSIGTNGVAVTSGDNHMCAILADHTVKCWGYNYFGQLGDNTTTDNSSPSSVSGLSGQAGVTTTSTSSTTTSTTSTTIAASSTGNSATTTTVSGISKSSSTGTKTTTASSSGLPMSGSNSYPTLFVAVMLLASGVVISTRRRRLSK